MTSRNLINSNFWQVANVDANGSVIGIESESYASGNSNIAIQPNANISMSSNGVAGVVTVSAATNPSTHTSTAIVALGDTVIPLNNVTGLAVGRPLVAATFLAPGTLITNITALNVTVNTPSILEAPLGTTFTSTNPTSLVNVAGNLTVAGESNLGPVGNVTITGGSNGQALFTDGAGNLSWVTISADKIVNGNSNVVVAANANVTVSSNGVANVMTVSAAIITTTYTTTALSAIGASTLTLDTVAGLLVGDKLINATVLSPNTIVTDVTGLVVTVDQPLIAAAPIGTAFTTVENTSRVTLADAFTVAGKSNLGPVGNVTITGGNNKQFLQTDGTGNLTWATVDSFQIANGNSNVVVRANAAVTTSANGLANILVINSNGTHGQSTFKNDVTITGNLNVQGNATYINTTSQTITDPIFDIGVGANNTPLVTDDALDRGMAMHSYGDGADYVTDGSTPAGNTFIAIANTVGIVVGMEIGDPTNGNLLTKHTTVLAINANSNIQISSATLGIIPAATTLGIGSDIIRFVGWDTGNAEMLLASNVSIANNEVTVNELGNTRLGTLIGRGNIDANTNVANSFMNLVTNANNANIALSALGTNSTVRLTTVANASNITLNTSGINSRVILNTAGNTANVQIGTAGLDSHLALTTTGNSANVITSTTGTSSRISTSTTGNTSNITTTTTGPESLITVGTTGDDSNIEVTTTGNAANVLISAAGDESTVTVEATGNAGLLKLFASDSSGNADVAGGAITISTEISNANSNFASGDIFIAANSAANAGGRISMTTAQGVLNINAGTGTNSTANLQLFSANGNVLIRATNGGVYGNGAIIGMNARAADANTTAVTAQYTAAPGTGNANATVSQTFSTTGTNGSATTTILTNSTVGNTAMTVRSVGNSNANSNTTTTMFFEALGANASIGLAASPSVANANVITISANSVLLGNSTNVRYGNVANVAQANASLDYFPIVLDSTGTIRKQPIISTLVPVIDNTVTVPPVEPALDDSYLVPASLGILAPTNVATTDTLATLSTGTVTYNNGTAGVGATLTTTGSYTTIDDITLTIGMRVLVKNEVATANNGIYVVTSATVLTRATDFDTPAEMPANSGIRVSSGTVNANTGWTSGIAVVTVGTTAVTWTSSSNAWVGYGNDIATWSGSDWTYYVPANNDVTTVLTGVNAGSAYLWNGTAWILQTVNSTLPISNWTLTASYISGALVVYNGVIYQANAAIPANTPFVIGTTGATWRSVSNGGGAQAVQSFTATAGQTVFTVTTATPVGKAQMFINGVQISAAASTTSGFTVTYVPANNAGYVLIPGDIVTIVYFYGTINANFVNAENGAVTTITDLQTSASTAYNDVAGGGFVLPTAGVWEVTYDVSGYSNVASSWSVCITDNANVLVPGSVATVSGASNAPVIAIQSLYITTTVSNTAYKLRYASASSASTVTLRNNTTIGVAGSSSINFTKISGFIPITAITTATTQFGNIAVTSGSNVDFTTAANVALGPVGNVRITGGTNGQVLTTNGSGALSWTTAVPAADFFGLYLNGGYSLDIPALSSIDFPLATPAWTRQLNVSGYTLGATFITVPTSGTYRITLNSMIYTTDSEFATPILTFHTIDRDRTGFGRSPITGTEISMVQNIRYNLAMDNIVDLQAGDRIFYNVNDGGVTAFMDFVKFSFTIEKISGFTPLLNAPIPNWTPSTIQSVGIGAVTTAPTLPTAGVTTNQLNFKQVGPRTWQVQGSYVTETASGGNAGVGEYLLTLPNGLQFDTSVMGQTLVTAAASFTNATRSIQNSRVSMSHFASSANGYTGYIMPYSATQYRVVFITSGNALQTWGQLNQPVTNGFLGISWQFEFQSL